MSRDLKRRGWSFVGPTTVYAFMQAMGLVNDHVERCWFRARCEAERPRSFGPRLDAIANASRYLLTSVCQLGSAPAARAHLATLLDEVDEHVVAERLGRGEEGAAAVQLRELLDERAAGSRVASSMNVLMRMPSRVQRITSASVASIVSATGG